MGSSAVLLPQLPALGQRVLDALAVPSVITNVGNGNAYLDTAPQVSDTINEYVLAPGQSIVWVENTECWAVSSSKPMGQGELNITQQVSAFTSPTLGGAGATNQTVLYYGSLAGAGAANPINTAGYSSVRIVSNGYFSSGLVGAVLQPTWGIGGPSFTEVCRIDNMTFTPSGVIGTQFDWTLDVAGPLLWFNVPTAFPNPPPPIIVIGLTNRAPELMFETGDPNTLTIFPKQGPVWFTEAGLLPANDGTAHQLPVWSGTIQVEASAIYVGAITNPVMILVYDTILGPNYGGQMVPMIVQPSSAAGYRGSIAFRGSRRPRTVRAFHGSGYTSVTVTIGLTFSGTEDSF